MSNIKTITVNPVNNRIDQRYSTYRFFWSHYQQRRI